MKKRLKAYAIFIFMIILLLSQTVSAAADIKLQLYFAPQIMNDQTGEVVVNINIRNFKAAVPSYMGSLCGISFKFGYDTENFDIKKDDNGGVYLYTDEKSLIKNTNDIEIKEDSGEVNVSFLDSTLKDNLIENNGSLFGFVLISKEPKKLWNSFDAYPIRFAEGTVSAAAYRLSDYKVSRIYNVEAIDGSVGGYNKQPNFIMPSINRHIEFKDGETGIKADDEVIDTDAAPFKTGDTFMLPVRYIAESIGMSVEWDGDVMTASAYGEYKTLKIRLKADTESGGTTGEVFVNSTRTDTDIKPIEKDGRIYIPVSVIKELYPNAKITETENSVEIYIP